MNNNDMPSIVPLHYGTSTNAGQWAEAAQGIGLSGFNIHTPATDQLVQQLRQLGQVRAHAHNINQPQPTLMPKRIVRVYLADVDDNIPLEKSLLYSGSEKLTDLTDQELYFEIPINELLSKHNAYRQTLVDKKSTQKLGKEVFLEPVKIRDLKMTVVCIAAF